MAFCERQWALIHVEQQWAENVKTVEGKHIHERADDPFQNETRGNLRIERSVPVISKRLGLQGVADVVEFIRDDEAPLPEVITLKRRKGKWKVHPVEYKRGKPKRDDRDVVQLCAQAMALEEMMNVKIAKGYLFYYQTRHRKEIFFNDTIRTRVENLAHRMHRMMTDGFVPKAQKEKHCSLCSLVEICQPDWNKPKAAVEKYLREMLVNEQGSD